MTRLPSLLVLTSVLLLGPSARAQDLQPPRPAPSSPNRAAKPTPEPVEPSPEPAPPAEPASEPPSAPAALPAAPEPLREPEPEPEASERAAPPVIAIDPPPPPADPPPRPCSKRQVQRAFAQAERALVRVASVWGPATGFALGSGRHIVTTFESVSWGRGVEVETARGRRLEAEVVAVARDDNLALLRVAEGELEPLPLGGDPLDVGDAMLGLAAEPFGPPRVVIKSGLVSSRTAGMLYSDAFEPARPEPGTAVLDCRGRVIGIVNQPLSGGIVGIDAAVGLRDKIGTQPVYEGGWSLAHPSVGALLQGAPGRLGVGLSLGAALIGDDAWFFPMRLGLVGVVDPKRRETEQLVGLRTQLELGVGYRAMLSGGEVPIYLVPTVGAVAAYERFRARICDGRCNGDNTLYTSGHQRVLTAPTFGLGLGFAFGELSYQLQLDVKEPRMSTHQVLLGMQF